MARKFKMTKTHIILILVAVIGAYYLFLGSGSKQNTATLTDNWINAVTVKHDPAYIASLFCSDGNLVGTVSQTIRKDDAIKQYFNYFAKLPGIKVLKREYDIQKVSNNVYLNTAFITWTWDDLDEPIVARMTFIFRGNCIFQLHSSALPDLNESLKKTPYILN